MGKKTKGGAATESAETKQPLQPLGPGQVRMKRLGGEVEQHWLDGGKQRAAILLPNAEVVMDGDSARLIHDRAPEAWEVTEGSLPEPIDPTKDETLPEETRKQLEEEAAAKNE